MADGKFHKSNGRGKIKHFADGGMVDNYGSDITTKKKDVSNPRQRASEKLNPAEIDTGKIPKFNETRDERDADFSEREYKKGKK